VVAELVERLAVAAVEDVGVEAEDVLEFEVDGFGFVGFPATRLRRLPRSTGLAGRTPRAFRGLRGYGRSRRGRRRQANLVLWAVSTPRCVGASGRRRIHTVYFWREIWRPALELAGLDYYRAPYNLRHTFAYWSLRAGVPSAAVAPRHGPRNHRTHLPHLRRVVPRSRRRHRPPPQRMGRNHRCARLRRD